LETVVFYVFAALAVAGAIVVIAHSNPVYSAVSLVLTLFSTAVLFILLHADFVAVIQVLVYAGAIMILFIFTVMFLNLRPESFKFDSKYMYFKVSVFFALLLLVGYFASIGFRMGLKINYAGEPADFGSAEGVGTVLFTDYLLPFELTSVLIVAAIIGVVAIAKKREG
jgi:NADH-quinone oxidoreductase subunit J